MSAFPNAKRGQLVRVLGLFAVLAVGCMDSGPKGLAVKGRVTWEGAPVKFGYLVVTPNIDDGGTGPMVTMAIKDGLFESKPAQDLRPGTCFLGFEVYADDVADAQPIAVPTTTYTFTETSSEVNFDLTRADVKRR